LARRLVYAYDDIREWRSAFMAVDLEHRAAAELLHHLGDVVAQIAHADDPDRFLVLMDEAAATMRRVNELLGSLALPLVTTHERASWQ
jgi:hypothetical protein